jgi:hypothetical protein
MRPDLITFVAICLGVLFAGSLAAFLLFVPLFTVTTVSTILLGLMVMFGLGVQAGGRRIRIKRPKNSSYPSV